MIPQMLKLYRHLHSIGLDNSKWQYCKFTFIYILLQLVWSCTPVADNDIDNVVLLPSSSSQHSTILLTNEPTPPLRDDVSGANSTTHNAPLKNTQNVAALPKPASTASKPIFMGGHRIKAIGDLIGVNEHDIIKRMRKPTLRRSEGEVEIWLYRGDACFIDLYMQHNNDIYVVNYAHFRTHSNQPINFIQCLQRIATSNVG